jgi:hypothetical protein
VFRDRLDRAFVVMAAPSALGLPLRFIRSSTTGPLTDVARDPDVFENPPGKHINLCVTLEKLRVTLRTLPRELPAPIYGRYGCSVRNGLHKEKILVAATPFASLTERCRLPRPVAQGLRPSPPMPGITTACKTRSESQRDSHEGGQREEPAVGAGLRQRGCGDDGQATSSEQGGCKE